MSIDEERELVERLAALPLLVDAVFIGQLTLSRLNCPHKQVRYFKIGLFHLMKLTAGRRGFLH
ncbi:hypothetical protein [Aromatoleum sp.]|uniref:hypothetical protein n=1 Tax=Aromatoleum sp. TaxID=2307007 RepID=UPI002FC6DA03